MHTFTINQKDSKKIRKWNEEHLCSLKEEAGAIGGRLTYSFTPTSLGVIYTIKCACGEELDLTEYDKW